MIANDTRAPRRRRDAIVVAGWVAALAAAIVVGDVYRRGRPIEVGAVPWVGSWDFDAHLLGRLALAGIAVGALVWTLPVIAARRSTRAVVASTLAATVVITFLLAWSGPDATHWPGLRYGYGAHIHLVDDWHGPAAFLRHYVARQPRLTAHLRAHPPGLVLALWALARVGFEGRTVDLTLMLAFGALANGAALVALRNVAGTAALRAAAPFVALAPVVVWRTNADVVFAGVALAAVSLVVVSTGAEGWRRTLFAIGGGALFGVALLLTYGVLLLVVPIAAIGWHRRAFVALACAGCAIVLTVATPAVLGFSWIAGLLETRHQYDHSVAHVRGYAYWLLGNAAIYLALIGPATVVALGRLKGGAVRWLVFGGLACVVIAGLSGLSSAETERIWQPFVPLVVLAGGALWVAGGRLDDATEGFDVHAARRWLALQAVVALGFQSVLWTRV